MSVCEQMAEVRETRKREAQARADELARKDANGKKVDPIEALDTLIAAGLPDDWLEKRVHTTRPARGSLPSRPSNPRRNAPRLRPRRNSRKPRPRSRPRSNILRIGGTPHSRRLNWPTGSWSRSGEGGTVAGHLQGSCNHGRLAEIGPEIGHLQDEARGLEHRRAGAQRELARLEPQLAEHEARKTQHAPRPGNPAIRPGQRDPATSWVPSAYDPQEHANMQAAVTKAQGDCRSSKAPSLPSPAELRR